MQIDLEICPVSEFKQWVPHETKDYPKSYEDSVWNKDPEKEKYIIKETDTVTMMHDKFPACEGHLLFIPKFNQPRYVAEAMAEAYQHGSDEKDAGRIDGFNIGMNIDECAGQSVFWPHIHLIPRMKGDQDIDHKGIRSCYPNDAYKRKECEGKRRARISRKAIEKMRKELEAKCGGPWRQDW